MLAARRLGFVPVEAHTQQAQLRLIVEQMRKAWAPQVKYDSLVARKIAERTLTAIQRFEQAAGVASINDAVRAQDKIIEAVRSALSQVALYKAPMAQVISAAGQGGAVELPTFRADVPAILDGIAQAWQSLFPVYDYDLTWLPGATGLELVRDYTQIAKLAIEQKPAARTIGKILLLSLGAAGIAGGVGYAVWRGMRPRVPRPPRRAPTVPVRGGIFNLAPPHELPPPDDDEEDDDAPGRYRFSF